MSHPNQNEDKASDENDCIGSNDKAWLEDSDPEDSQRKLCIVFINMHFHSRSDLLARAKIYL